MLVFLHYTNLKSIGGVFSVQHNEHNMSSSHQTTKTFASVATNIIDHTFEKKKKRNIWENSKWAHIAELENDDVGKVGEIIMQQFCIHTNIPAEIDGLKTKKLGGGIGDGIINGKTVEIKTARLGSDGKSFQHELGEVPWVADYMIFLDIAPEKMYITIFRNFEEKFYKQSGCNSKIKCKPYFPTKSICWRKQKGAFKLDTTIEINNKNTFTFTYDTHMNDWSKLREFINFRTNEVTYLIDTWNLTQSQSEKLHNGFHQNTIDAKTLCQILNEDITDLITLDVAQDAIKFKGIDNKLTFSGFEEFMNERLPELDIPLHPTFT